MPIPSMRILLIKPKHIGDSLILTPTIVALKAAHPEAEIWVMVRRGCEGILAGCPEITRILTLTGVGDKERSPGDLWRQAMVVLRLWSVTFDYVFELGDGHRARLFAILTRARRRYSVKTASPLTGLEQRRFTAVSTFDSQFCHRVEKDFYSVAEFLPLAEPIPALRFDREFAREWKPASALTDFCVMQIGKRQLVSRWNREGWLGVGRHLLERCNSVVIASGPAPDEVEEAAWLAAQLGSRALSTRGEADWPQMAELLYRARLYVGLDTAAMHLAAACGCPVVALFGPSLEDHWHPWRVPYRIVTSHGYVPVDDLAERHDLARKRTMNEIKAEDVITACDKLLAETNRVRP
jgi:heptosyltransferase III